MTLHQTTCKTRDSPIFLSGRATSDGGHYSRFVRTIEDSPCLSSVIEQHSNCSNNPIQPMENEPWQASTRSP
jgi:hypothetical protein